MGRVKLCLVIVILVPVLCVVSLIYMRVKTDRLIELTLNMKEYCREKNREKALEAADILEREWEEYQTAAGIFIRNEKISSVQSSMTRIKPMIESDCNELEAEIENAISELEWITESELPVLSNIL